MRAELAGQITSPMNTSGVAEPPEISVASVARFVSVFVGAETSVTWMFGYAFSNWLISTVRVSVAPALAMGLADHTIVPEVAEPLADAAPLPARCCRWRRWTTNRCCRSRPGRVPRLPRRRQSAASPSRGVFRDICAIPCFLH